MDSTRTRQWRERDFTGSPPPNPSCPQMEKGGPMTVESIDGRQLEASNKEYERPPEGFTLGIEARTIWEGRGLGNLGRIGRWSLGGQTMEKPTRDFSVQLGSWR